MLFRSVIERVTFHNDESGFCVLRVRARGQREETTVVGSLPSVTAGEWLAAEHSRGRIKLVVRVHSHVHKTYTSVTLTIAISFHRVFGKI